MASRAQSSAACSMVLRSFILPAMDGLQQRPSSLRVKLSQLAAVATAELRQQNLGDTHDKPPRWRRAGWRGVIVLSR